MTLLAIEKVGALGPAGLLGHYTRQGQAEGDPMAAALGELAARLPGASLRRVPRPAKIALRAALEVWDAASPPGALIIGAAYGSVGGTFDFLDTLLRDGAALASPTAFSQSVANMVAALVSQYLGLSGPCLTVTQATLTPALEAAAALLFSGQAASVLWGTLSEGSPLMTEIEKRAGREPFTPSEGAVFFRLARPEARAKQIWLEFGSDRSITGQCFSDGDASAELHGHGPLATALRLALACQSLENDLPTTVCSIADSEERLFVFRGDLA